jgi:hypothetical protein
MHSIHPARPDIVMFTFLDYIGCNNLKNLSDFREWLQYHEIEEVRRMKVFVSNKTRKFIDYHRN